MWGFVKIILCKNDSADLVLLENFEMFLARVVYDDSLATSHFKIFHYHNGFTLLLTHLIIILTKLPTSTPVPKEEEVSSLDTTALRASPGCPKASPRIPNG